ncbi:hypothetical protein N7470_009972 [Penicillium chermesinum]|nr:hypothetical protein N7470_009972 [Penicillium chermesinum]
MASQSHPIHVAVLDTDIPCLSVYAQRGLYSSQFRVLLQAAAERLNKNARTSLPNGPLGVHVTAFDAVGGIIASTRIASHEPGVSNRDACLTGPH